MNSNEPVVKIGQISHRTGEILSKLDNFPRKQANIELQAYNWSFRDDIRKVSLQFLQLQEVAKYFFGKRGVTYPLYMRYSRRIRRKSANSISVFDRTAYLWLFAYD